MAGLRILNSPFFLTAVSATFIFLIAPPIGWGALFLWFLLVPWLRAIEKTSGIRGAFVQGIWLSFLFNITIYAWGAYAFHEFAGMPWTLSLLILGVVATIAQPQFLVFAVLYRWLWGRRISVEARPAWIAVHSLFLAFAYTGIDWIAPKMFVDTFGQGFIYMRNFRQVADLGGAHLLTFLVLLSNLLVVGILWRRAWRPLVPQALICAFVAGGFWAYGWVRSAELQRSMADPKLTIRAAAIQANIPNLVKLAAELGVSEAMDEILSGFRDKTAEALADRNPPHLVVWPETAFPMYFDSPRDLKELARERGFRAYVSNLPVPLVTGSYEKASPAKDYNSMIFFPRDPDRRTSYRKHVLLHFGDYIPGESLFPSLRELMPKSVGRFLAGDGPAKVSLALRVGGREEIVNFLPIICYEAIFPSYVRRGALLEPEVILNVTNDSWFGPMGEPQLHLALSAFRSIETRLPQLRVTNTGITALILPDGEITGETGIGESVWRNYDIPILRSAEPTLFMRWGDWFGPFSIVMAGLTGTGIIVRRRSDDYA